jgi:hypothetical protein
MMIRPNWLVQDGTLVLNVALGRLDLITAPSGHGRYLRIAAVHVSASNDHSRALWLLTESGADQVPSGRSSVEIGRYGRVAAVGEHASDLLR